MIVETQMVEQLTNRIYTHKRMRTQQAHKKWCVWVCVCVLYRNTTITVNYVWGCIFMSGSVVIVCGWFRVKVSIVSMYGFMSRSVGDVFAIVSMFHVGI